MRTAGIIGGLGPETTAKFYMELMRGCYIKNKVNRPPIMMWSVPQKYDIERDLIMKATGEERYVPYLTDAARRLEKGGADFLAMPCNSLHTFIGEIRESVKIPVLSIVEETASFLRRACVKEVGILATSTTLNRRLYEQALKVEGIRQLAPDETDQSKILQAIDNLLMNRHIDMDRQQLLSVIDKFACRGIKDVILACTDLQLLKPSHERIRIHDTMKILADATVEKILS